LFGDRCESVVQCLTTNPGDQACWHQSFPINLGDGVCKGFVTWLASQTWRIDVNHHAFAMCRHVADEQFQFVVSNGFPNAIAMWTHYGIGNWCGLGMVFGISFFDIGNL
jgi:hypothetical protein